MRLERLIKPYLAYRRADSAYFQTVVLYHLFRFVQLILCQVHYVRLVNKARFNITHAFSGKVLNLLGEVIDYLICKCT